MTENPIVAQHHKIFEEIRHFDSNGAEYWLARELQTALEYAKWENFLNVIVKAKIACQTAGNTMENHFPDIRKKVFLGYGVEREIDDIALSRYACYLIVQNGDPAKAVIAQGQTYFAIQTRRQELADEQAYGPLGEDEKRLLLRQEMAHHNKELASAAKDAGVITGLDYAIFQDEGYRGLYGGLGQKDIHIRKGLKKSQKILDHMGPTELAANLFRATQTADKLQKENIKGKALASHTHRAVGKKVRKAIKDIGGTMPENLPTPERSIRQLTAAQKKINAAKKGEE
jgi:DNA-damage-inducible protein D